MLLPETITSNEWKVMMQSLPPGFSLSIIAPIESLSTSSSLLSSILIAWNVLFEGCEPFSRTFAGIDALMISFSSNVVSIGFFCLLIFPEQHDDLE